MIMRSYRSAIASIGWLSNSESGRMVHSIATSGACRWKARVRGSSGPVARRCPHANPRRFRLLTPSPSLYNQAVFQEPLLHAPDPAMSPAAGMGSLVDLAHDELHRLITDGELAEGERIVIDRFARRLGTSLIPVREALARVHAEGRVTFRRTQGYRVALRPTRDDLRRLFEARLVIEMGAAELALDRWDRKALDNLKTINRLIEGGAYGTTFKAFRTFVTLNERFHVEVVALAGNRPLSEAYRRLGYHQQITRPTFGRGPGDVTRFVREHDAIIAALEARDAAAVRQAIWRHIASGFENFELDASTRDESLLSSHVSLDRGPRKPAGRTVASRARKKGT